MKQELRKEIRKSRIFDSFKKVAECYRNGMIPEAKTIDNIAHELYNELFYDMDMVLNDGIEDKIKEIIKSPTSSMNEKPNEILSLLGLNNRDIDVKIEDEEHINISMDNTPKKERILDCPAKHSLVDIFKELKFGRPAASQQYLQECIEFLEKGGDIPTSKSDDKLPNFKFTPPVPSEITIGDKFDTSKLRPYNRIDRLSSLEDQMDISDLKKELTDLVFKYGKTHFYKKDLELSIKIMEDVIVHPEFYLP